MLSIIKFKVLKILIKLCDMIITINLNLFLSYLNNSIFNKIEMLIIGLIIEK